MMYGKYALSLAAALAVAGCSRTGGSESEDPPAQAVRDSAATPAAGGAHAMHDTTAADSGAAQGMAGMDHSTMPGMDHAAAGGGGPAGAAHSGAHGAASAEAAGHAAMGHSGADGAGTPGADHAGMNHGGATSTGEGPSGAHAGMNHGGAAGTGQAAAAGGHAGHTPAQAQGAGHAGMAHAGQAASGRAQHGAAGGSDHAAMGHGEATSASAGAQHTPAAAGGHGGMDHGSGVAAARSQAADEGTRKLLDLAGELVRDPAVQREIQQDPALREGWADPGVRRVVTKQP